MANNENKEVLRVKYMQMAKIFNWHIPQTHSNPSLSNTSNNNQNILNNNLTINQNTKVNESNSMIRSPQNNCRKNKKTIPISEICTICGSSISSFLIDNHKRHCAKNYNKEEKDEEEPIQSKQSLSPLSQTLLPLQPQIILNQELISCKYCEYQCDTKSIFDHEMYCGARTDLCTICNKRDSIQNLTENKHKCCIQNISNPPIFDLCSSEDDIDQNNSFLSVERNRNNSNNNRPQITPQLIREERERMERQNQIDHEFAMNLQREMMEQQIGNNNIANTSQLHNLHSINLNVSNMSYNELLERFPSEPNGAKEAMIQRLPTEIFRKTNNMNDKQHKCCICMECIKNGEQIRRLQCFHVFHKEEIDKWLRQNRVCPICRIDVEEYR